MNYFKQTIWSLPKKIFTLSNEMPCCPNCSSAIKDFYTLIPISNEIEEKIPGRECVVCECLYISPSHERHVKALLTDNVFAKDFTLNNTQFWNYSEKVRMRRKMEHRLQAQKQRENMLQQEESRKQEKLRRFSSAVLLISIICSEQIVEYVIVSDKKEQNKKINVLHYSEKIAREFLTAAYMPARNKQGNFESNEYKIMDIFVNRHNGGFTKKILVENILIKSGGGYASTIKNRQKELVELLLYSPFTGRYEICNATYDKAEDYCYMDVGIFRDFIKEFGNPGLSIDFSHKKYSSSDLNEESILRGYGYSVARNSMMSRKQRQELLCELVDLDILTVQRIISLLSFFIDLHTQDKDYFARQEWAADKAFISKYKVNPERFLIAGINSVHSSW